MADRFGVGAPRGILPAGLEPIWERFPGLPGFGEVVRQQVWLGLPGIGKLLFQHPGHGLVQLLAAALQQRLVSRIADQGMLEHVARLRRQAAAKDQLGFEQLVERVHQFRVGGAAHGSQELVGKLAADDGCRLGDLLDRRQAVEAGDERIVQGRGNRQQWQRPAQRQAAATLLEDPHLEHGLGQFLDEQRHAVGLGEDLLQHFVGKRFVARQGLHHGLARLPPNPVQGERRDVRVPAPRRGKHRSIGNYDEHAKRLHPVDHQVQQLVTGGVDPVHVLEHDEQWRLRGERVHLFEQLGEGPILELFRAQVHRREAVAGRNRQQGGE
jgi:aryl carrier-like protein